MCDKLTYESYQEAQKVVNAASKVGRNIEHGRKRLANKKPKRVYKCEKCGMYHLTSKKKIK